MELAKIFQRLEACVYELSTESRRHVAGLKEKQELAPIMERYADLADLKTVVEVRGAYVAVPDAINKEALRRLYFELVMMFLDRQTVTETDRLATELAQRKIEVDDERIAYHDIGSKLANEPDFERRERLHQAQLAVVAELNPEYLALWQKELMSLTSDVGFKNYLDFTGQRKSLDYQRFSQVVTALAARLEPLYQERMKTWAERDLGHAFGTMNSCHIPCLLKMSQFDQLFPKEKMLPVFEATVAGLGLDGAAQRNIHLDLEYRPSKLSRACCFSAKIPSEIHLLIKPIGGRVDYKSFFHEAGHAEHFAHVDSALPYAFRELHLSHAVSELFSYTFESLTWNRVWLVERLGLSADVAQQVAYYSELADLFLLVRYLGKFSYEYALHRDGDWNVGPELYAKHLTQTTNFIYQPENYLNDMDAGFYSADYLRAWLGRATLVRHFEGLAGERWFEDERVGAELRDLWRSGFTVELEELLLDRGLSQSFDIEPIIARYEKNLKI